MISLYYALLDQRTQHIVRHPIPYDYHNPVLLHHISTTLSSSSQNHLTPQQRSEIFTLTGYKERKTSTLGVDFSNSESSMLSQEARDIVRKKFSALKTYYKATFESYGKNDNERIQKIYKEIIDKIQIKKTQAQQEQGSQEEISRYDRIIDLLTNQVSAMSFDPQDRLKSIIYETNLTEMFVFYYVSSKDPDQISDIYKEDVQKYGMQFILDNALATLIGSLDEIQTAHGMHGPSCKMGMFGRIGVNMSTYNKIATVFENESQIFKQLDKSVIEYLTIDPTTAKNVLDNITAYILMDPDEQDNAEKARQYLRNVMQTWSHQPALSSSIFAQLIHTLEMSKSVELKKSIQSNISHPQLTARSEERR